MSPSPKSSFNIPSCSPSQTDVILAPAVIVISPEDVNTRLGHTLLLPCVVATRDSSTVHVTWKHNDQPINPTPQLQVHPLMASQREGVMFIKSVLEVCVTREELAGDYSCTAVDGQETLDQETFHIRFDSEFRSLIAGQPVRSQEDTMSLAMPMEEGHKHNEA